MGRWTALSVIGLVIFIGLLVGLARVALPILGDGLRPALAQRLSDPLQRPVRISSLRLSWEGRGPVARISGLQVLASPDGMPVAELGDATVGFDLVGSILQGRLITDQLWFQAPTIHLYEDLEGRLRVGPPDRPPWEADLPTVLSIATAFPRFDIYGGNLFVHPADPDQAILHYRKVDFSLRNANQHRELGLSISSSDDAEPSLTVVGHVQGPARQPENWTAAMYARIDAVDLAQTPWSALSEHIRSGRVTGELWFEGSLQRLTRLGGRLDVSDLEVPHPLAQGMPPEVSTSFRWYVDDQGWTLIHDWVRLSREMDSWSMPGFAVRAVGEDWLRPDAVALEASRVPLVELTHWRELMRARGVPEQLASMTLRGTASDIALSWAASAPGASVRGGARLDGVGFDPVGSVPGIDGAAAELSVSGRQVAVRLDSRDTTLNAPELFPHPLPIKRLSGILDIGLEQDGWSLASNEITIDTMDLASLLRLRLDGGQRGGQPTQIDLQAYFQNGRVAAVPRYLPVGIMRAPLVDWLNRSLVNGRMPSGGLIVRGPLNKIPYRDHDGVLLAELGVEDGILDFHPAWPRVEELDAELTLRGAGFSAKARHGHMLQLSPGDTWLEIPDLAQPVLTLETQVSADAADLVDYVNASAPLQSVLGPTLDRLSLAGPTALEVRFSRPLKPKAPASVAGALTFDGTELAIRDRDMDFTGLTGGSRFTERSFNAEGLQATLWNRAVLLDLSAADKKLNATLRGKLETGTLLRRYLPQPDWAEHVVGESPWRADLTLPGADGGLRLRLNSSLVGTGILAPEPLGKPESSERPVSLDYSVDSAGRARIQTEYGPVRASLNLDQREPGSGVQRVSVRLGPGEIEPAAGPGLTLVGDLETLDLDAWSSFVGKGSAASDLSGLDRLDLRLGHFHGFGTDLANVRTEADSGEIRFTVDDPMIMGAVSLPRPLGSGTIEARFQRLNLKPPDTEPAAHSWPSPDSLPAIRVRVDDLMLDGDSLGSLEAASRPGSGAMLLDRVALSGRHYTLTGQGDWTRSDGADLTHLILQFNADDAGDAFGQLGLGKAARGGTATGDLDLSWPKPLPELDLATLEGRVNLNVLDGKIADVEAGVGRLVGLFNLGAISRRLRLDFTDVFEEGYRFDSIEAQLRFSEGNMYQEPLVSKGPSAFLSMTGRVGIQARDYDLDLWVSPQVGGSLPLAGLLAGGPAVGAALFIAGTVFKQGLDKVLRVQYTIDGAWDAPVIEPVRVVPAREDEAEGQEGGSR